MPNLLAHLRSLGLSQADMELDACITHLEAARRLGVSPTTIQQMLARNDLERSPAPADGSRRPRGVPSIDAQSVERLRLVREQRRAEREAAERRRAEAGQPPDSEHVWLDTPAVAALTGMSRPWVKQRAQEGRIPATKHGGQWWLRREDAEVLAAARAAVRRADSSTYPVQDGPA